MGYTDSPAASSASVSLPAAVVFPEQVGPVRRRMRMPSSAHYRLTAADSATSRASKSASAVSTVRRASSGVPSDGGTVL